MNQNDTRKWIVRENYSKIALQSRDQNQTSCCGAGGCGDSVVFSDDYTNETGYNPDADLGLGCGIPTRFAAINPGDTVLDLGSGAGNDVFVARAATGEHGRVIGVDMTPEMIKKAETNLAKFDYSNIEFREGEIEALPVDDDSVDVALSNCVLNLVPDKQKAFSEIFRVLKPGGHFSISDVVLYGTLPESLHDVAVLYAGCISGAIQKQSYLDTITRVGFTQIEVLSEKAITIPDELIEQNLSPEQLAEYKTSDARVTSITVTARKPVA